MTDSARDRSSQPRSNFALWIGLLGAPLIWLSQFEARYVLASHPPGSRGHVVMVIIGIVAVLLIAACSLLAFRERRLADASPLDQFTGAPERTRFMGTLGVWMSVLFLAVTVAQLLADLFIEPGKI
jgi:hypothetical protein